MRASGRHKDRRDATGEDRADYGAGDDVLLGPEKCLDHAPHVVAAGHAAGYLRNYDPRKLKVGMALAVLDQHLGHLFRRGNAHVCNHAAVQGPRVVEVQNIFGEVGAVPRNRMKMRLVL